jgi:hypothetical protein
LYIHETESENLIHSGREWYQPVNYLKDTEIDPGFKDIVTSEKIKYTIRVLARASVATQFRLEENGSSLGTLTVAGINLTSATGTYAQATQAEGEALPSSSAPVYKVSFTNNGEISAKGWIDYVKIHARRLNKFDGQTMHYTDSKTVGAGTITEFTIKSSSNGVVIWDVSDPHSARIIPYARTGDNITFKLSTDSLKTVVAFIDNNLKTAELRPVVLPNQDIHASPGADMIIVTHPAFVSYSEQLAEIRKTAGSSQWSLPLNRSIMSSPEVFPISSL